MRALVCVSLKTMNASCGMDFCLSEGLANNDHTNEVLFCENFNHGTLPAPSAVDFVILRWALHSDDDWLDTCGWNAASAL